jgi:receptor-type tyrosine-protein phosphatase O
MYFCLKQIVTTFHVTVQDADNILVFLEASDLVGSASVYVVKITGESKNYFFEFEEFNSTLPPPVIFKANYHGLYYIITLVVVNGNVVTKPSRSITVLTSKHHVCCHLVSPLSVFPWGSP